MTTLRRFVPAVLTVGVLALIGRRIPVGRLFSALHDANYTAFLAVMIPNTIMYFCWDTLILKTVIGRFHGDVPYRDLLPVRAASYVIGFFNTNAGRGVPFLELGGTVMFLVLTEYTQLVLWAMLGVFGFRADVRTGLLPIAAGVAALWVAFFVYTRLHVTPRRALRWLFTPREWLVFRTFRRATAAWYAQIVLLRAPMFLVSLWAHYYGAQAFGIHIPFGQMLTFLPVIFMVAALPVTVAHLGTTQAAWLLFFGQFAPAPRLLAFSLVAHLTFAATRALLGLAWLPVVYAELVPSFVGFRKAMVTDGSSATISVSQ